MRSKETYHRSSMECSKDMTVVTAFLLESNSSSSMLHHPIIQSRIKWNERQQRRPSMKRSLVVFLGLAVATCLVSGQNPEVNVRTIECADTDPPFVGYDRMQDVINDQFEEFQRIENGQEPRPPYVFRLCPNTMFDMSMPLPVLLSDSMFVCGPNLTSMDNCVFAGGFEQVKFERMALEGYVMEHASFVGITFDAFTGSSVNAYGLAGSTASFMDCTWQNYQANSVVKLGVETGVATAGAQMRVEIGGLSKILKGMAGSHFINDGGEMVFNNVRFDNLQGVVSS